MIDRNRSFPANRCLGCPLRVKTLLKKIAFGGVCAAGIIRVETTRYGNSNWGRNACAIAAPMVPVAARCSITRDRMRTSIVPDPNVVSMTDDRCAGRIDDPCKQSVPPSTCRWKRGRGLEWVALATIQNLVIARRDNLGARTVSFQQDGQCLLLALLGRQQETPLRPTFETSAARLSASGGCWSAGMS